MLIGVRDLGELVDVLPGGGKVFLVVAQFCLERFRLLHQDNLVVFQLCYLPPVTLDFMTEGRYSLFFRVSYCWTFSLEVSRRVWICSSRFLMATSFNWTLLLRGADGFGIGGKFVLCPLLIRREPLEVELQAPDVLVFVLENEQLFQFGQHEKGKREMKFPGRSDR